MHRPPGRPRAFALPTETAARNLGTTSVTRPQGGSATAGPASTEAARSGGLLGPALEPPGGSSRVNPGGAADTMLRAVESALRNRGQGSAARMD